MPHTDRAAPPAVPPLADEDHHCAACDLRYPQLSVEDARTLIADVGERAARLCGPVPADVLRSRPAPHVWSGLEYLCHLRDVHATATIRLHRVRTEDGPTLEPMLNDLRARRFRYNELDPDAVLGELALTAAGFLDEIARVPAEGWDRTATRLPDEWRSARWIVRHTAHEGVHHLADIATVLAATRRAGSGR